jgi:hypothetical protein
MKPLDGIFGLKDLFSNPVSPRATDTYDTDPGLANGRGYGGDSILV